MVLTAFTIIPIIAVICVWLLHTIISLVQLLLNILAGLGVLVWFAISIISQFIYSFWWHVASAANHLVVYIWPSVHLPIDIVVHVLKHFGFLSFSITHLALRVLYYVFLLWIFVCLLILLFRFITC